MYDNPFSVLIKEWYRVYLQFTHIILRLRKASKLKKLVFIIFKSKSH